MPATASEESIAVALGACLAAPRGPVGDLLRGTARALVRAALAEAGGHRLTAARALGVTRRQIDRWLARWPELESTED